MLLIIHSTKNFYVRVRDTICASLLIWLLHYGRVSPISSLLDNHCVRSGQAALLRVWSFLIGLLQSCTTESRRLFSLRLWRRTSFTANYHDWVHQHFYTLVVLVHLLPLVILVHLGDRSSHLTYSCRFGLLRCTVVRSLLLNWRRSNWFS